MNCATGFVPGRQKYVNALDRIAAALGSMLGDPDWEVRYKAAAIFLGVLHRTRFVEESTETTLSQQLVSVLSEQLHDKNVSVRLAAVEHLKHIHTPGAVASLLDAMDNDDAEVRLQATKGLIFCLPYSYFPASDVLQRLRPAIPKIVDYVNLHPGETRNQGFEWAISTIRPDLEFQFRGDGTILMQAKRDQPKRPSLSNR
jgi:hypothetical protein